jgi:two-component system chemotaxis response regulator CheY
MKILIVDDSKAMRMIVRRALRQAGFGDHPVEEAANGKEALQTIASSPPDLVLADWNMPEMSGIELLSALRRSKCQVTFGFVTSESTEQIRQVARAAGAAFLIAKPFEPEAIRQAINQALR